MPEVFVAKVADIPDGERKIVQHGAHDIGVFHWGGQFYAYSNLCLHQGGPACEGLRMPQVKELVDENGVFHGNMDLSMRPLGTVVGNFIPNTTGVAVPFCGTFRLPFAVDWDGQRTNPRRGVPAYYMADDGQTVFPAVAEEKSLRMPTVRLELKFGKKCK